MDKTVLSWLSVLATTAIGETVNVKVLQRTDAIGVAGRDAHAWRIELAPDLSPDVALRALAHELGHVALQHIPRDRPSMPRPVAGSILDRLVLASEAERGIEKAADAWGERWLASLDDRTRQVTRAMLGDADAAVWLARSITDRG